jgi:hypothetical protein
MGSERHTMRFVRLWLRQLSVIHLDDDVNDDDNDAINDVHDEDIKKLSPATDTLQFIAYLIKYHGTNDERNIGHRDSGERNDVSTHTKLDCTRELPYIGIWPRTRTGGHVTAQ